MTEETRGCGYNASELRPDMTLREALDQTFDRECREDLLRVIGTIRSGRLPAVVPGNAYEPELTRLLDLKPQIPPWVDEVEAALAAPGASYRDGAAAEARYGDEARAHVRALESALATAVDAIRYAGIEQGRGSDYVVFSGKGEDETLAEIADLLGPDGCRGVDRMLPWSLRAYARTREERTEPAGEKAGVAPMGEGDAET